MRTFTTSSVTALRPCPDWPEQRVAALVGDGFTAPDVLGAVERGDVPRDAALWLLSGLVGPDIQLVAVEVGVYGALTYGIDGVADDWDSRWVLHEARTIRDLFLAGRLRPAFRARPFSWVCGCCTAGVIEGVLEDLGEPPDGMYAWVLQRLVTWVDHAHALRESHRRASLASGSYPSDLSELVPEVP